MSDEYDQETLELVHDFDGIAQALREKGQKIAVLSGLLAEVTKNLERLLELCGERARCRGCGKEIFWVQHVNGNLAPYTSEGKNHFIDCPNAKDFRRAKHHG